MPHFSIVIPTYNRQRLVGRAIESCLRQSYRDFEVIVSDDASTDGSCAVVSRYTDPRVRLVRSDRNRGVCPTRNNGFAAATGEWIVCLDSDDELLPDALMTMSRRAAILPPDVDQMLFMYHLDTGGYTPDPPFAGKVWDYRGYLRWRESLRGPSDCCHCIRRKTFAVVKWPSDRTFDGSYSLEFALHFRTQAFPDVVGVMHSDADNRSTVRPLETVLQVGADNARWAEGNLAKHETSMAAHCPRAFRTLIQVIAVSYFLSGNRKKGWKTAWKLLRLRPLAWRPWVLMALGVLDARSFGRIIGWKPSQIVRRWIPGKNVRPGRDCIPPVADHCPTGACGPTERKVA